MLKILTCTRILKGFKVIAAMELIFDEWPLRARLFQLNDISAHHSFERAYMIAGVGSSNIVGRNISFK